MEDNHIDPDLVPLSALIQSALYGLLCSGHHPSIEYSYSGEGAYALD